MRFMRGKINVLLNVDNYFGKSSGRLAPFLIFLGISAIPMFLYIPFMGIVPLWIVIIFELLWTGRWYLKILGHEKERLAKYKKRKEAKYALANSLVKIVNVFEDGCIEYMNTSCAYLICGFPNSYFDTTKFVSDCELFFSSMRASSFDIHLQLVTDEDKLQDDLSGLQIYTDEELKQERVQVYKMQDEYSSMRSELFRYIISVKFSKYSKNTIRASLDELLSSNLSKFFHSVYICNRQQVIDILSRDLGLYVDIDELLSKAYANNEFYGSEVLFYGEDIPDEYKPKSPPPNLGGRRVIYKEK